MFEDEEGASGRPEGSGAPNCGTGAGTVEIRAARTVAKEHASDVVGCQVVQLA